MKTRKIFSRLFRSLLTSFCIAAMSVPPSGRGCAGSQGPACALSPSPCLKSLSLAKSAPTGMGLVGFPGGTVTLVFTLTATCPSCPTTPCPMPATPTSATASVAFYPGGLGPCPPLPPAGAPTFSFTNGVALPACTPAGAFTTYTIVVPVPASTPIGFYCAYGAVTVRFSDGVTLTANGDTAVCIVDPVPGMPGVPRLSLTLLSASAPRLAPGEGHLARYAVKNNDPSNSVTLIAISGARQSAVRPQGANERQGVFAISNPFGDDFPILFNPGTNCIPLPAHPYTQQPITNSLPILPPGGSNTITVGIRSYGQCANGSCSESTLKVTATFSDNTHALACAGMALIVDTSQPSSACASSVNDCNHNGIPDALDIAAGRSQDRNFNAMPDECEQFINVPTSTSVSPTNPQPAAPILVQAAFNEVVPMTNVWANGSSLTRMTIGGLPFWQGTIPADTRPGPQTVYFLGKDQAGGISTFIAPYTVQTPNTPPTISDIPNQVILQNTSTGLIPFTIGDAETPATGLTLSGSSSNPALVPNANIVFGGSGSSRTVTVTPVPTQTGFATITVTVTDANGGSAVDTFIVMVQPTGVIEVFSPSRNPTPPNFVYATLPGSLAIAFPNGFVLRNIKHGRLRLHPPPPLLGNNQVYTSDSDVRFEVSTNGGASFIPAVVPSDVSVRLSNVADDGANRGFTLEMLTLNIAGGTLPPGVRIRESPTLVSPGQATSRVLAGGGSLVSGFFDVNTELSINNGATWQAANIAARVVLSADAPEVFSLSGNPTPPSAVYVSRPGVTTTNQNGARLRNISHGRLRLHPPPPALGGNLVYTSDGEVRLEFSPPGNTAFSPAIAPSTVSVRLSLVKDDGNSQFFDTEMLSLDVAGGTLPAGVRIRESPTRQSLGRATARKLPGGGVMVSGFFDVETDVSVNNGATYQPSLLPVHLELAMEAPEGLSLSGNSTPPNFSFNTPTNPPLVTNGTGLIFRRVRHGRLALHPPPPPLGNNIIYSSPSTARIEFSMNGGVSFTEATASGTVSVRVTNVKEDGTSQFFDTEMLSLDVSGGTLPPGVLLRESPTRQSLGRATGRDAGSGTRLVSSFFDVELELSNNGGATWFPNLSPIRVELTEEAPENLAHSDNLTPANSGYVASSNAASVHYGGALFARGFIHYRLDPHPPLPPPGGSLMYTSVSSGRFQVSLDGERTYSNYLATGVTEVSLTHATDIGPTRFFDTELRRLDLTGGNLPPGVRLRVSPTLPSRGQAAVRSVGSDFHLDSFFDVFTQLSFDNGATWFDGRNSLRVALLAPSLAIQRAGTNLTVSWVPPEVPQVLQCATNVTGIWSNLPTATNPYQTDTRDPRRFYRVFFGP